MSELTVGKKAPAFTLVNQNDEKVSLKDLAGQWVVLYFYPKDDTPGCTKEACELHRGIKGFEKLDAEVVGASPDSAESHQKFIAKYKLKLRAALRPRQEDARSVRRVGRENDVRQEVDRASSARR